MYVTLIEECDVVSTGRLPFLLSCARCSSLSLCIYIYSVIVLGSP